MAIDAKQNILLRILDLARWAPSGDNTQPWRFEIVADDHIAIHGFDTRDRVIYDFDGHPSQMAHGALLETLRIAASGFQLEAEWTRRPGCPDTAPIYDVILHPRPELPADPLLAFIEQRVVQRRAMRTAPLTDEQRRQLTLAAGPDFTLQFFESRAARFAVAKLLWHSAKIRLTCPEAFEVHREIIEWGARFSADRIPEEAVGVDPLTAKLMKWVMQSWDRVEFFNRYLLGTLAPRIQLDLIPALTCAGHILLRPAQPGELDPVGAGVALQRLWLTTTALGLHLQPEMTPVIFRWYVRSGKRFSALRGINLLAQKLAERFEKLTAVNEGEHFSFLCRIGQSPRPWSRSIRKNLDDLMVQGKKL